MTDKQIIEDGVRFARRNGIEATPKQKRDLVRFQRDFVDEGMREAEAFERACDLAFGVVEDSPYRCGT